jgi:predicted SprT family Zn-dependent metalloprotease
MLERSWVNGPLRKVGSGAGKASKYACDLCEQQVSGIYRQNIGPKQAEMWLCAGCREEIRPKREQPKHLRKVSA